MQQLTLLFDNFLQLSAEASPWLLLGLLIAGLMKAWVPTKVLSKHLGQGNKAIVKAALIGAPLPLCSCGVIPVATELRRSGASAPATSAFLVATPETGVDSVSVSYAMLGPIFAIYRPVTAILSAIITGLLVATIKKEAPIATDKVLSSCCSKRSPNAEATPVEKKVSCCASASAKVKTSCCSSKHEKPEHDGPEHEQGEKKITPCCSSKAQHQLIAETPSSPQQKAISKAIQKTLFGIKYASTQLIDDLIYWLALGLIFATLVQTFIPQSFLLQYGSGLPAMLMMIVISIPMYICATASTPIAAGFIMAGLSPGTALVFMMAGPATNISTLGVIKKEMGSAVLLRYLVGISSCAIIFGLLLDWGLSTYAIDISKQMSHSHSLLPHWFGLVCTATIVLLSIKPLRKQFIGD